MAAQWARKSSRRAAFLGWGLQFLGAGVDPVPPPQVQLEEVGSLLAFTVNLALVHYLEMTRLPATYIALGSAILLTLGQCAALTGEAAQL